MSQESYFRHLTTHGIAEFIRSASGFVCYAAPAIQDEPASALVGVVERLGKEMVTVCLDVDGEVFRMGFGTFDSVKKINESGVFINNTPGLRSGLIIVDDKGYMFTPNAELLERESESEHARNALLLSRDQVMEALARLSPAAKVIAVAQAKTADEKERISKLEVEVKSSKLDDEQLRKVGRELKDAPPAKFDLARQVRVFSSYLEYVELNLTGASIDRNKISIPKTLQQLGRSVDVGNRLHTTFDLIEEQSKLSSKKLNERLNQIRNDYTKSLGKKYGRVVLKSVKYRLEEEIETFKLELEGYQEEVKESLQDELDKSREQIVDYYYPLAAESLKTDNPNPALIGSLGPDPSEWEVRSWIAAVLSQNFPDADSLIKKMSLDDVFKGMTIQTLKASEFIGLVKNAYPHKNWGKVHEEYLAAGQRN